MKFKIGLFGLFFLIVNGSGVSSAQSLQQLLSGLSNREAFWSVSVRNAEGKMLESVSPDKLIIPASNQKLYTTAAVLDRLGGDFTYTTVIYGIGFQRDSVWVGDLIIKGAGDPSISGTLYNGDREYVFRSFLKQIRQKGIRYIDGRFISDISYFDDEVYPPGWDWYDLNFYYGVQINALSFNNNAFDLEVFAEGDVGSKPRIDWYPKINAITIQNNQTIVEPNKKYDEYYRRFMGTNTFNLASELPLGYYETESLAIDGADAFFLETFKDFLEKNGIGSKTQKQFNLHCKNRSYADAVILASHTSKNMAEMVNRVNKESDNYYAEMLLKTLAAEKHGSPATFKDGVNEVRGFLASQKVDTNLVLMNDGSGLASGNYTTTSNLTQLLVAMQAHPEFDNFYGSLPIAGVDGSLAYRFKNSPLTHNLRGKTGFVGGVRTLSGYFYSQTGQRLSYSIATNHFRGKTSVVDISHQKILEYLYYKY